MGWLLRFIFLSLLFTWVYNQVFRPLFDGMRPPKKPAQRAKPKKEIEIEYRKFPPDEGDYIDYEEVK